MIKPNPLKKGDLIEIISPSGKISPDLIDAAVKRLIAEGYKVNIAPHAKGRYNKFSGTDDQRHEDLQNALNNPEIKAVLCARGGYGSMRIMDNLDFTPAVKQRKWLIGFSDITALHTAAYLRGMISLHGIMVKNIVTGSDESVNQFFSILRGETTTIRTNPHTLNHQGNASGTLLGGNLSMLFALRCTKYDLNWNNALLFLEDIEENLYHLDRIMQNLKLGGKFENISALLVGQFTNMLDKEFGKSAYDIIHEAVLDYDFPVVFDVPLGHVDFSLNFLHGAEGEVEVTKKGAFINIH
jgi:muramoyltetrapeptide carboxypeptidase